MTVPPHTLNDPDRLASLSRTGLLDAPAEPAFDRLTRLATAVLGVPVSLVSLVDHERQFFAGSAGLAGPLEGVRETPLSHSFCQHVVTSGRPLVVNDARKSELLKGNPVIELGVVAYAGYPIVLRDGTVLGSFCAIDQQPHEWTETQLAVLRDLTDSVVTEIELRRTNEELRATLEAKDRFMAMLSHDLRTPLTPALLTAARLAASADVPAALRDEVALIHRNIELEVSMIDSLLDLTRISTGKLELHVETHDLHELVRASIGMCDGDARGRGVRVETDFKATRSAVRVDGPKLQQVVCNLLKNAAKFSQGGGVIRIVARDNETGGVTLSVTDNGLGITVERLAGIFDAFEQGGRATTRQFGGLGLGLAICRGIIDAHGGTISATSAGAGLGTTMTVTLPDAEMPARPAAVQATPQGPGKPKALRILLVEDHADSLFAMAKLLTLFKHDVTPAQSVAEALAAAESGTFDLIVSDLGLPDGTGLDVMRRLNATRPIPGIALTGYGMEADIEQTQAAGFGTHLTKPVNLMELRAAIERVALSA